MKLIIDIDEEQYKRIVEHTDTTYDMVSLLTIIEDGIPLEFGNISVEAIEELSHCPACIHYIQRDIPNVFCEKCVNRDELYGRIENDK